MDAHELGRLGEDEALHFLERRGMTVLERNVRFRCGEIDLVVRDGEELAFVEVRSRSTNPFQRGEESVGPRKLRRMLRAARTYVETRRYAGNWRIDLVAVERTPSGELRLEHFPDLTGGGAAG
jgi:putative endonuclease